MPASRNINFRYFAYACESLRSLTSERNVCDRQMAKRAVGDTLPIGIRMWEQQQSQYKVEQFKISLRLPAGQRGLCTTASRIDNIELYVEMRPSRCDGVSLLIL